MAELLAPNGKPSKLTPEQYKLVRTPEFKAWFGDWENDPVNASKVVDENGEPLVLNHSTRKNQKEDGSYEDYFDIDSWLQERGNYLFSTPNSSVNPIFLSRKGKYALSDDIWQIKFFANIKNLFDTDNKNHLKKLQEYTIKTYSKYGDYNEMAEDLYGGGYETFEVDYKIGEKRNKWENSGSIPALISEMGYDAYINNDENVIVVFDRNKLKLADGSNTKFDGNNPDIRYADGGSVLLAPNGKPSNLSPEQYELVRTPAFKKWFGDWENLILTKINDSGIDEISLKRLEDGVSKVVDKNGEPLPVYHGTNSEFYEFDKDKIGTKTDYGFFGQGFYFTDDKKEAKKLLATNKIIECFLNIKKPIESVEFLSYENSINFTKNSIKLGRDGIIIPLKKISLSAELLTEWDNWYIVFEPEQIKLADGTNTTFDGNNPDIRFDGGGAINKSNDFIGTWEELKKYNPNLWETGILRRSQNPQGATDIIPKDVFIRQFQWQNYGQYDEIEAETIYGEPDNYGYYNDKDGNPITDERTGNYITDELDYENNAERIKATISNKQLKNNLIDSFQTQEGKEYLKKVIATLPKNEDGTITAYRIGTIGEDLQSYTLSEGMAKTFSNQGTDIMPSGLPSIPNEGYKDYGVLPVNKVKINPKGIVAWSPYDSEILVELKYIKTDNSENSYADGGLIAPNGKPSNLTPEQYKLVRTDAFKNWFGDWENDPANASKVVDENGEPLVVYHGTNNDFYTFDKSKIGLNHRESKSDVYGGGFFFTDKKNKAFSGNIKEVFLKIKKPLLNVIEDKYGYEVDYYHATDTFDLNSTSYFQIAKENRNNGIIIKTPRGSLYIAFKPTQIKLADGSNTTFDSNNPDIRFDNGGIVIQPIENKLALNYLSRTSDGYGQFIGKNGNLFYIRFDKNGTSNPSVKVFDGQKLNDALSNGYGIGWIAVAEFDVDSENKTFSGYSENNSILVDEQYRRLGIATAMTDFAEEKLGMKYTPSKLLSEEMQRFVNNRFNYEKGGRTIAQTPAPKKERIYGSEKNKPESSKDTESAEKIEFNEKTLETIKNKVAEHNEKNPKKKVALASAKAVVRRGMGAYSSSHRPTIKGGKPNSRVAWGLARLNAFFYKIINGKSKSGKYNQDDDLINELGYKVKKYADGGEIANIMRNEIIDILSKNSRYGKQIISVQEAGIEVIQSCIESNTYFGNAIRQANENYIMIPVSYDDKLWASDKKVGYVYFAKPNENTKIRVEYKYDLQEYPVPVLFDSELMNNEEFYDVNDYEEIKSYKFDSEFLYRGINNDEMLSIIENGFIKSNASMNIGKQQEETTSFAQDISQASAYAVGFNAWFDEVTFAKPKYILKVKKEGVNYKPTIETDIENEVDVFGEIPIQQIESIYEFRLGECQMGQVEINVGYNNEFSDGSRSPMFKKVFVRKTDINSIIERNKIQKYADGGQVEKMKKLFLQNGFTEDELQVIVEENPNYFNQIEFYDNETLIVYRTIALPRRLVNKFIQLDKKQIGDGIGEYWTLNKEFARSVWGRGHYEEEETFDVMCIGHLKIKDIDWQMMKYAYKDDYWHFTSESEIRGVNGGNSIKVVDCVEIYLGGGELKDFVLYHGTGNANKVIQALKDGSFIFHKSAGVENGIFLTPNKKIALDYANYTKGEDIGVLEVRFNEIPNFKKYNNAKEQYEDEKKYDQFSPRIASEKYIQDLITQGYDGYSTGEVYLLFKDKVDVVNIDKTSISYKLENGGDIQAYEEAMGISQFDEGGEAKPKKVYVSIPIKYEYQDILNEKGLWDGTKFQKYQEKTFEDLKNGQLKGVIGVSSSPHNVGEWFVHRDCLIVMKYDEFVKINDFTIIDYDNPEQLMSDDMKLFNRLYAGKRDENTNEIQLKSQRENSLQNILKKFNMPFKIAIRKEPNLLKKQGLYRIQYFLKEYYDFIDWILKNNYIINNPKELSEKIIEYHYSDSSNQISTFYGNTEDKTLNAEYILPYVIEGVVLAGNVFKSEQEIYLNNKTLNIPSNSQLFFRKHFYGKEKESKSNFSELIDKYKLSEKYRIYFVKYKDIEKYSLLASEQRINKAQEKIELEKKELEIKKNKVINDLLYFFFDKSLNSLKEIIDKEISEYSDSTLFYYDGDEEYKEVYWYGIVLVQLMVNKYIEIIQNNWKKHISSQEVKNITINSFYRFQNDSYNDLKEYFDANKSELEKINDYRNIKGGWLSQYRIEYWLKKSVDDYENMPEWIDHKELAKMYLEKMDAQMYRYYTEDEIPLFSKYKDGGETDEPTNFWGDEAGGVLIYCSTTDRYLILLRSDWVTEPNTWGIVSGKLDEDEDEIQQAVYREAEEEIGYKLRNLIPTYIFEKPNFKFHNFVSIVNEEFVPQLNWENTDYKWVKLNEIPDNIHFGLKKLLENEDMPKLVKKHRMENEILVIDMNMYRYDTSVNFKNKEIPLKLNAPMNQVQFIEWAEENDFEFEQWGDAGIDDVSWGYTFEIPLNNYIDYLKTENLYTGGELKKGIKTEMEHKDTIKKIKTGDYTIKESAELIAKDHLDENDKYYTKLMKMEKQFDNGGKVENIKSKKGDIKLSLDENWYLDDTDVELVPVSELIKFREFDRKVNPKYNQDNSRDNINHLKFMFQKEGVKSPLIIEYSPQNNSVLIIEGNHRLNSAIDLGMEYLPARVVLKKYGTFTPNQLKNTMQVSGVKADESGYIKSSLKPSEIGIEGVMPIIYREGGIIEGRLHSECGDDGCGRKFQVGEGGHIIEAERDEAVIVADTFNDNEKYTIEGTPSEIASALNVMGGGKNFDKGATIVKNGEQIEIPQLKKEAKDTDVDDIIDSGSIIINRRSMADENKYEVTGTPKQIASAINSVNGNGVVIQEGATIKKN